MSTSNFTAQLHYYDGQIGVVDSLDPSQDGWLCTRLHDKFRGVRFAFTFIDADDRGRSYRISAAEGWAYEGALVQSNGNGWVGLYGLGVVGRIMEALAAARNLGEAADWRMETLTEWDGDMKTAENVEFHLLDKHGQAMAIRKYSHDFLQPSGALGKRPQVKQKTFDYLSVDKEAQHKKVRFMLRDIRPA